jgi:indolepyruvate ferredoxin oxidoreductase
MADTGSATAPKLNDVSLDDKYTAEDGLVFMTGTQALVRLPMDQHRRDKAAGLNTAGFITGYRGSPLGAYDQQLAKSHKLLKENQILFRPGVNEDLAATAVWGSQQSGLYGDGKHDGVFGIWYGKGPGVDRSGDAFKHANAAGTLKNGGVLAFAGDDHMAKSSTSAHQSEYAFVDAYIPVIAPSGVQEFLDLGLHGFAMSRFSGLWTGFKCIGETVDSAATVSVDPNRVKPIIPTDFEMPEGGLNSKLIVAEFLMLEEILHKYKLPAALAYARANRLDRVIWSGPQRRIGIVTTGKSYLDVRQALDDLGIDEATAASIGLAVYKVAMTWPLETEGAKAFAEGLETLLVVEEKRSLMEWQLKDALYSVPADRRPEILGKTDRSGAPLLQSNGELTPGMIARVIARLLDNDQIPSELRARIGERLAGMDALTASTGGNQPPSMVRTPYFCSGCPHNTSTKVPEGSRAGAGIGCHYMAMWMDRSTAGFTHMGAEGVNWTGQAPFVDTPHIFQNLGDGTYYHSGLLAIRAAVSAGTNMTYKILYNDAVAMTGGQSHDGPLDPVQMAHQVWSEGVKRVTIVYDEKEDLPENATWPPGTKTFERAELDKVQRELREVAGVTCLIYIQTCAAEKRRRRKRGLFPDPDKRIFINEAVCEGCGDCGVKSNCVSVAPIDTEFGRKRKIDQSSCNKDFSCVNGFCPSFVTVKGGKPRKSKGVEGQEPPHLFPVPDIPTLEKPFGIMITGIGGTGVITIGALLSMAAHIEGKASTVMDMTGLAQKGGAVWSHLRIANTPEELHAVRIASGGARSLIGCDLVTSGQADTVSKLTRGSKAVVNSYRQFTGDFTRDPDFKFPTEEIKGRITSATGEEGVDFLDATDIATRLMGDSIATNMFMLGYAFQKGMIPVSAEAIMRAIELNEVAIESNKRSFNWGRAGAANLSMVMDVLGGEKKATGQADIAQTLDEVVAKRIAFLTDYQNARYAKRYQNLVERVRAAEAEKGLGEKLSEAVARYYFKLMAYKDEYEVARLYSRPEFLAGLEAQFEGDYTLEFNLAPPMLSKVDPVTGEPQKKTYGPSMMKKFGWLAKMRGVRGTPLDVFGRTEERKMERQLIRDYEKTVGDLLTSLSSDNHRYAVEIASIPEHIRGYGHVKVKHLADAKANEEALWLNFRNPSAATAMAAE